MSVRASNAGSTIVAVAPTATFVLLSALLFAVNRTAYPNLHGAFDSLLTGLATEASE